MRINKEDCTGLVVDIQERLFPVMEGKDELLRKCRMLLEGLNILEVPVLLTEQYPKGLGSTIAPIQEVLQAHSPIEKISFSCCDEPLFCGTLAKLSRRVVIISGIEAHVCVLQTVIDLLDEGFTPVVVADCIASRNLSDKSIALDRMLAEGARITTCESILFELARVAGTEQFKTISHLVK